MNICIIMLMMLTFKHAEKGIGIKCIFREERISPFMIIFFFSVFIPSKFWGRSKIISWTEAWTVCQQSQFRKFICVSPPLHVTNKTLGEKNKCNWIKMFFCAMFYSIIPKDSWENHMHVWSINNISKWGEKI